MRAEVTVTWHNTALISSLFVLKLKETVHWSGNTMPSLKIDITHYTRPFIISTASCLWSPDVGLAGKFLSPWRTCLSQFIFQPQPNPRQQKIDKDNCSNLETSVNISATKAGLRKTCISFQATHTIVKNYKSTIGTVCESAPLEIQNWSSAQQFYKKESSKESLLTLDKRCDLV